MGNMGHGKQHKKLHRSLSARIRAALAISQSRSRKPRGRFVVPLWYPSNPLFQDLLDLAEEEFGFDHPMGGLTVPCSEDYFVGLMSALNCWVSEQKL